MNKAFTLEWHMQLTGFGRRFLCAVHEFPTHGHIKLLLTSLYACAYLISYFFVCHVSSLGWQIITFFFFRPQLWPFWTFQLHFFRTVAEMREKNTLSIPPLPALEIFRIKWIIKKLIRRLQLPREAHRPETPAIDWQMTTRRDNVIIILFRQVY